MLQGRIGCGIVGKFGYVAAQDLNHIYSLDTSVNVLSWSHNGYLPPYWNDSVDDEGLNHIFNYQHSSLRNVVERAFGVLKGKWRILKGVPRYERDKQAKIVVACFALHNYVLHCGDILLHHDNQPYIEGPNPATRGG
jgi:hypothetical protein